MTNGKIGQLNRAAIPSIRMGEMSVAADGETLRTLLGSCVGLALFDQRRKVGGLAHIVMPDSKGLTDRPGKYVNTAIPLLIDKMTKLAGNKLTLKAKIAGGASMFTTTVAAKIGQQNIDACEAILRQLSIPIIARHCGGEQGRRMLLDSANGIVVIDIVGQDSFEL